MNTEHASRNPFDRYGINLGIELDPTMATFVDHTIVASPELFNQTTNYDGSSTWDPTRVIGKVGLMLSTRFVWAEDEKSNRVHIGITCLEKLDKFRMPFSTEYDEKQKPRYEWEVARELLEKAKLLMPRNVSPLEIKSVHDFELKSMEQLVSLLSSQGLKLANSSA